MNDNSPQKVRKLHQFIKHHNAPEKPPVSRKWWWKGAWAMVALLILGGLVRLLVEFVDWRDLIPQVAQPNPPPVIEQPVEEPPREENWLEDLLADRLRPRERREALLRLVSIHDESGVGESVIFQNHQREALVELAEKFPEDELVTGVVLICLKRDGMREAALQALNRLKHRDEEMADTLAELAQDKDRPLAVAALAVLVKLDPFRVCETKTDIEPLLLSLLKHSDARVRVSAIQCLGTRQHGRPPDEQTDQLARRLGLLLNDEDREVQTAAGMVLSDLGLAGTAVVTDRWTPPANPDLKHRSGFHGLEAITVYELWALAQGGKASLPAARSVIRNMERHHSPLSAYVLAEMGPGAAPSLLEEHGGYESERAYVVKSWGEAALPVYLAALESKREFATGLALVALGEKGKPAVPILTKWLADKDRSVRLTALDLIRDFGPIAKEAIPALEAHRAQDEREQRDLAATLYCLDPSPQRLAAWQEFLATGLDQKADSQKRDFSRGMWSLLKPFPREIDLEILEKAWDGGDRDRAAHGLIMNQESLRPAPPKLFDLLRHEKDYVRRAAARVVGSIGEPAVQAAPDLIKMTDAPKYEERITALEALGAVGAFGWKTEAMGTLEAWRVDGQESEKKVAAYALRRIEIESRKELLPAIGGPAAFTLSENLAYLNHHGAPEKGNEYDDTVPAGAALQPFDSAAWIAKFKEVRGNSREFQYGSNPIALIHEAARHGKDAASAVPYLWAAVHEAHNGNLVHASLYALWKITGSRLVSYAMIDRGQLVLPIAAETLEQDLILVPMLRSYRALLTLPLPEQAKRAVRPSLTNSAMWREAPWDAAVRWHLYQDPKALQDLEWRLYWEYDDEIDHEHVAWALGFVGPPARRHIPRLARLAYWGRSPYTSAAAAKAIWRIDRGAAVDWKIP